MNRVINLLLVIAVSGSFAPVWAATDQPPVLPKLESATMSLTWSDFKELIEKLQRPKPEEEQKLPLPPFEWAISRARYNATAVDSASVRVEANLDIEVLKQKGYVAVPVLEDTVAPVSVKLNGEEKSLASGENKWLSVVINKPGAHRLELVFFVRCASQDGVVSFAFGCPRTPVTLMTLSVPVPDATVESASAVNLSVDRAEKALTAELTFHSTDNLAVSWTLPAVLNQRKEALPPVETPRVASLVSTLAAVTDRYIACESLLRYEILRGGLDAFRLHLPRTANVLNVTGQGAAWSSVETGDSQTIEVKVNHRVEDNYEFSVRYEAPFEENTATLKTPTLEVLDVVRQTGFIGVTARANVEVAADPAATGLIRVDTSELPATVRAMSPNPVLLAFKYTGNAYVLPLDVRRLEDVPVRVATINRAELVTVITNEGAAVTRARYQVLNNVKQFLRVEVPKGADVWCADVGGKMVKPAREAQSGAVLIPLSKSAETNRSLGAFPVEIVYMEQVAKAPWMTGRLDLEAPATDLLANEFQWQVFTPETQRVYRSTGDLSPVSGYPSLYVFWDVAMRKGTGDLSPVSGYPSLPIKTTTAGTRDTSGTRRETLARLRESANRPATAPAQQQIPSTPPAPAPANPGVPAAVQPQTRPAAADAEIAGVVPVQIDLPVEGVAHAFRRLIAPEEEPLKLTLYIYHQRLATVASGTLSLATFGIGLLAGCLAALAFRGRRPPEKWTVIAVAGVAGFVMLKALFGAALKPLILGFLLALALSCAVAWRHKRLAAPPHSFSEELAPKLEE